MYTCCHSGYCLYLSNSISHSAFVIGGSVPVSFQSVIESPDRVSLVIPPTVTIPATNPLIPSNQYAICLLFDSCAVNVVAVVHHLFVEFDHFNCFEDFRSEFRAKLLNILRVRFRSVDSTVRNFSSKCQTL